MSEATQSEWIAVRFSGGFCPRVAGYAIVAVAMWFAGCDRGLPDANVAAEDPGFAVWDSAGVEIVENHAPHWPAGGFWTIDPGPEIVLGGAGDLTGTADDPSLLVWQVVGLARLTDGRVAVLSSGSRQLMLFAPSGELSLTIGGPGEGPGEFTHPLTLQYLSPDTLVVWDYFLSSIDYFDTDGNLLKERSLDFARMSVHGIGAESLRLPMPDGSFLAGVPDISVDESLDDCSHLATPARSSHLEGGRVLLETEIVVPGEELLRIDDSYAAHSFGCARPYWTHLAVGGNPPFVYVSIDHMEVQQRSLDGTLVRIIRRTTEPPDPAVVDLDLCPRTTSNCWVGKDYFLIVRMDELGRERVEGYRIRRVSQ